jgi:hypothetical protein
LFTTSLLLTEATRSLKKEVSKYHGKKGKGT